MIVQKKGDWICKKCNKLNFQSKTKCFTVGCHQTKQQNEEIQYEKENFKYLNQIQNSIQDEPWICQNCNFDNFRRQICKKCKTPKEVNQIQAAQNLQISQNQQNISDIKVKKGDWECLNCKVLNFQSRNQCFKCQTPKQNEVINLETGDWICTNCQKINFKKRQQCMSCQKPKTENLQNSSSIFKQNTQVPQQNIQLDSQKAYKNNKKGKYGRKKEDSYIRPVEQQVPQKKDFENIQNQDINQQQVQQNSNQQVNQAIEDELTCSICFEILNEAVTVIPCLHNFCAQCIIDWCQKSDQCAFCKEDIISIRKNPTLNNLAQSMDQKKNFNNNCIMKENQLTIQQIKEIY